MGSFHKRGKKEIYNVENFLFNLRDCFAYYITPTKGKNEGR